jgi:hypothetical protein
MFIGNAPGKRAVATSDVASLAQPSTALGCEPILENIAL